ncbi:MAG TPA: Smr/MutS family protein [Stellaceae bacterium]|jgi:DNA-nicking Smr family endonuclease|nr:Smr/MutS family protein [Stellaceae bacterium]
MAKANNPVLAPGDRLWREAVRNVTPMRGRAAAVLPASGSAAPATAEERHGGQRVRPPALDHFSGVDRASAERLKRGLYPIEACLDLHGRTQAEAHHALAAFVHSSSEAGRRCVLVITGRGLGPSGPGVLKSAVPRWLEEVGLRRRILAIAPAQPRHGGAGALYLLLRRRRVEPPR